MGFLFYSLEWSFWTYSPQICKNLKFLSASMHLPNVVMKHISLTKFLQSLKTQQTNNRDFDDMCGFFLVFCFFA